MIAHLLSMLGCIIGCIVLIIAQFLAPNPSNLPFWQGAIGFLVLFFLVYWNLAIELKDNN